MFNLPFFKNTKSRKIKPAVLVIMDGWGLAPQSAGNAIKIAKTPNYDSLISNYPHTELIASGESVGLPANEVGNTEVGHLIIGAGRVIFQDLKRISMAIEKGFFFDNKALLGATSHVKLNKSKLHLMGLIGSGNVHSSLDHLFALIQLCKKEEVGSLYLHLFTDGRDSPPNEGIEIIKKIENYLSSARIGKIASVMGRYYAMDRDRRWDRTEKAYKALVLGRGLTANSAEEAVNASYTSGKSDEFIEPVLIAESGQPVVIDDKDAVVFYNFRIDRPKQLSMAFVLKDFENLKSFDFGYDPESSKEIGSVAIGNTFNREKILSNLFFVSMTQYHKSLPVSGVAFMPEEVKSGLAEVISKSGFPQAHLAESEKERFITYYFNGMREESFEREEDFIVASPKVPTYDLKPEMSLPSLVKTFSKVLESDKFNFIALNFANPDMVAHTGNLKATMKAIEIVDKYLMILVNDVLKADGVVFVTADHGNAEELVTYPADTFFFTTSRGTVNTDHSNNPVPFLVISNSLYKKPAVLPKGSLADVATTILSYMKLEIPPEMTGKNLFQPNNEAAVSMQKEEN